MSEHAEKRGKLSDVEAASPRYEGMTLGRMAQLLTRPKTPAARATLRPTTRPYARPRRRGRRDTLSALVHVRSTRL